MATLNVNIPIIEQTAAAWGADATVYPVKRILITSDVLWDGTDQRKYKISNGADTWSNLDYVPFEHTGEITGTTTLIVDKTAISNKSLVTAAAGDHVLIGDATDSDNLKKVNVSDFLGGGLGVIMTFWNAVRFNPADGTTYYWTQWANPSVDTNETNTQSFALKAMTIKCATISLVSGGGGAENVTFSIGINSVYTTITTTAQIDGGALNFENFALNIAVAQGDAINVKMISPVWATNPTAMRIHINIYGE